jgi:hypothetical protein
MHDFAEWPPQDDLQQAAPPAARPERGVRWAWGACPCRRTVANQSGSVADTRAKCENIGREKGLSRYNRAAQPGEESGKVLWDMSGEREERDMGKILFFVATMLVVSAGVTRADTLVVHGSYEHYLDYHVNIDVPRFDPALGDLQQVELELAVNFDGQFGFENTNPNGPGGFQVNYVDWTLDLASFGQTFIHRMGEWTYPRTMMPPFDGIIDFGGTSGVTLHFSDQANFEHTYLRDDPLFAEFLGPGMMSFAADSTDLYSVTLYGGNAAWFLFIDGTDDITVTYTYTPVGVLPGDLNCDGVVNFADISPFVLALSDPAAYQAQYPNCNILSGDINGDGQVNFADINPFVALLTGG